MIVATNAQSIADARDQAWLNGDDSCRYAQDGVCNEPDFCTSGTDISDCWDTDPYYLDQGDLDPKPSCITVQPSYIDEMLGFVAQATGDPVGPLGGALGGLLLGVGLVAASSLSHRLFGGDGFRVWAIEVGGDVVGLTLAGLVVGLLA